MKTRVQKTKTNKKMKCQDRPWNRARKDDNLFDTNGNGPTYLYIPTTPLIVR